MARKQKINRSAETPVTVFHHGDTGRLNIPDATETQPGLSKGKKRIYRYSPHLSPKLQFDPTGRADQVPTIVEKAIAGKTLTPDEAEVLRSLGEQAAEPWLEWAAKQEQQARRSFAVDDVVLHIHERLSAQAILATAKREDLSEQDLFARPKLHREQALQYYQHGVDWANRLIIGDSLQVISSLANRENLAGQVQMIYVDPPYGINFKSNWQNEIGQRDVKEAEEDLTRETEMIRVYRDTWTLGVHSYLAYLKQRLIVAKQLLTVSGSIFVQISDENLHLVRAVMDEVFGGKNFLRVIPFKKSGAQSTDFLPSNFDFLIWYAKDKASVKARPILVPKEETGAMIGQDIWIEHPSGYLERGGFTSFEALAEKTRAFTHRQVSSPGATKNGDFVIKLNGRSFLPPSGRHWSLAEDRIKTIAEAGYLFVIGNSLRAKDYIDRNSRSPLGNVWTDTSRSGFSDSLRYVVETSTKVVERCLLMTTDPGDLVLDPTCGSGTTAFVAEQWGRRWITIDSSRVSVAIARQRLLTALFESYKTKDPAAGADPAAPQNPVYGFCYKSMPHTTLKSIAKNQHLEPIFAKHSPVLSASLANLNSTLGKCGTEAGTLHAKLVDKLRSKLESDGARSISDADLRRWLVPGTEVDLLAFGTAKQRAKWKEAIPAGVGWQEHNVPFDADPDWPEQLQLALTAYRTAWRAKMDEVTAAIRANADQEELVDQPEIVRGVVRVSGPISVEGVRPEELALGEDGKLYDPTADTSDESAQADNAAAYIDLMIGLLFKDGVTFLGNRRAEFASLEKESGKSFQARGRWKGKEEGPETIAVVFGPQYGPINAPMTVEAIDAARGITEVTELVLAGFSFDAAAQEKAKEMDSEPLRIHLAHIRPDVSPGMQGLLKETPNSQLFTVFGQPDIRVFEASDGELKVEMNGVCIYNPLTGEISESSNKKVAAWFLDTDYDGHCFCISQAFFPNKEAWAKIAKAIGCSVSENLFEDFTTSWPFKPGKHKRIAVKVIDPRGNEVIAIKTLSA